MESQVDSRSIASPRVSETMDSTANIYTIAEQVSRRANDSDSPDHASTYSPKGKSRQASEDVKRVKHATFALSDESDYPTCVEYLSPLTYVPDMKTSLTHRTRRHIATPQTNATPSTTDLRHFWNIQPQSPPTEHADRVNSFQHIWSRKRSSTTSHASFPVEDHFDHAMDIRNYVANPQAFNPVLKVKAAFHLNEDFDTPFLSYTFLLPGLLYNTVDKVVDAIEEPKKSAADATAFIEANVRDLRPRAITMRLNCTIPALRYRYDTEVCGRTPERSNEHYGACGVPFAWNDAEARTIRAAYGKWFQETVLAYGSLPDEEKKADKDSFVVEVHTVLNTMFVPRREVAM